MHPIYAGTRLHNPSSQIRLLTCDPNTADDDTPSYSMTAHSLDTSWPEYVAISYTWGDVRPTLPLAVNDHAIRVRLHCWHALWQLRHHGLTGSLWIDSICINQEDNVEKSAQVSMMGQIYKRATLVAACIGTGDTLHQLGRTYDSSTIQALDELEQTPYFNRLWVKQEIILAKEVSLFCGTEMKNWQELEKVMDLASEHPIMEASNDSKGLAQPKLTALCEHRNFQSSTESRSGVSGSALLQVLIRYGDSKCVDARDKAFGLWSLLPEDDIAFRYITVDYGQSVWSLLCQIHAMCCHEPSKKVRSQSLLSLLQVEPRMNVDPQCLEVAQFLRHRLKPQTEPQAPGFLISDRFVELPTEETVYLRDVGDSGKWKQTLEESDSLYHRGGPVSKPALLTATMSVAEAIAHNEKYFRLPLTEASKAIQNHCFKQVIVLPYAFRNPGPGWAESRCPRFLVSNDTLPGDMIAKVLWQEDDAQEPRSTENTVLWAVLRRQASTAIFDLLCWAIPVDTNSQRDPTPTKEHFPLYSLTAQPYAKIDEGFRFFSSTVTGTLKLHYDDVLAFVAVARKGSNSLAMSATTQATGSRSTFLFKPRQGVHFHLPS